MSGFKSPRISREKLESMTAIEFDEFSAELSKINKAWMKEKMPDPKMKWAVVISGKIDRIGYIGDLVPTAYQVKEAGTATRRAYLVTRGRQFCNLDIYFRKDDQAGVNAILERDFEDITDYMQLEEGIKRLTIQSGSLINCLKAILL